MKDVGVSDIGIYVPGFYLTHEELARCRKIEKEKFEVGLGNLSMGVIPNWEDAVTMAASAALTLLERTGTDPGEIHQLVVSTESGVDHSKAVASFVQGLLNIGTRCRVYEVKHACYGGTAGLVDSIDRIALQSKAARKGLVIMTDIARYGFGTSGEATQGAGAVALLVEKNPKLFRINTSLNGLYSKHVFDFWRPTGHRVPIVDGKYSIQCYLTALEEGVSHFRENAGLQQGELLPFLDYVIYHMPFANMAKKAHRRLVEIECQGMDAHKVDDIYEQTFRDKVEPGLLGARKVGNIYTGSVYMGLVSLLEQEKQRAEGKRIGIFSYGSGCGAEFMLYEVEKGIGPIVEGFRFQEQLALRKEINFEQYVQFYSKSSEEVKYYREEAMSFKNRFTRFVFTGFEDHKRRYF